MIDAAGAVIVPSREDVPIEVEPLKVVTTIRVAALALPFNIENIDVSSALENEEETEVCEDDRLTFLTAVHAVFAEFLIDISTSCLKELELRLIEIVVLFPAVQFGVLANEDARGIVLSVMLELVLTRVVQVPDNDAFTSKNADSVNVLVPSLLCVTGTVRVKINFFCPGLSAGVAEVVSLFPLIVIDAVSAEDA